MQRRLMRLGDRLADSIGLALPTEAHCNSKRPQFIAIDEMLDNFGTRMGGVAFATALVAC